MFAMYGISLQCTVYVYDVGYKCTMYGYVYKVIQLLRLLIKRGLPFKFYSDKNSELQIFIF